MPPVNNTAPCCQNGGSDAVGPTGRGATPAAAMANWWSECVGGGSVPSASDITNSENWDPQ